MGGNWRWGPGGNTIEFARTTAAEAPFWDGNFVEKRASGAEVSRGQWRVDKDGTIRVSHDNNFSSDVTMHPKEDKVSITITSGNRKGQQKEGNKIQESGNAPAPAVQRTREDHKLDAAGV